MAEEVNVTRTLEQQQRELTEIGMSEKEEREQPDRVILETKGGEGTNETHALEDPFKKPDVFKAPSLPLKKPGAAAPVSTVDEEPVVENSVKSVIPEATHTGKEGLESEGDCGTSGDGILENGSDTTNDCSQTTSPTTAKPVKDNAASATVRGLASAQVLKAKLPSKVSDVKFKPCPPLPYTEPPWGGLAETSYYFEILKNGTILDTVPLTERSFFVFGRLPNCDVSLEHPSISRYHAVVQYRRRAGEEGVIGEEKGFYVFDLSSTHGTFVNKNKIPPKTYIRLRVGHVLKFGGSTRLFILQGPECDAEAESELSVTELRERSQRQREELEKRMMGDGSDEEREGEGEEEGESSTSGSCASEEGSCTWGIGEDALPEEDENAENPFASEFQEDPEALYLKDPKKALQGFFDREGEELEYEYDDKGRSTWVCRVRLPVDDAVGRQLVAEVTHTGKKKEAAIQCALEACRILEARGLLRQEAVSRKRRKKNWEEEDFYDSDDDAFLDRTGAVEKKRKDRMMKAGRIQEKPETYDSLVVKLEDVERELAETEQKLSSSGKSSDPSSSEDPLDAFMCEVRSGAALDSMARKKLHVRIAELRRERQRLQKLVEITRPAQLPALQPTGGSQPTETEKPRKLCLPMFGAMKGGSKFRLKTGTIGCLPPKRTDLPPELLNMKEMLPGQEEEEEEEEEEMPASQLKDKASDKLGPEEAGMSFQEEEPSETHSSGDSGGRPLAAARLESDTGDGEMRPPGPEAPSTASTPQGSVRTGDAKAAEASPKKKKKMCGPSRPPAGLLSARYPEDDPDYCVWVPPAGQTGDGRTHLNEKYGY
ncbi:kanadaptin [Lepisosteus oculatus]|uniref:kanadaptin n=1 Tax=Lepisosteus oculatus TaxID=7918 RepID=UPI0035F51FE2